MKPNMQLRIRGVQRYEDKEPETIELTTEAVMEHRDGVLFLRYQESELTGLEGTTTTFEIRLNKVLLRRTGMLNHEMEFAVGQTASSLYQMGDGAVLITIRTISIDDNMTLAGGSLRVLYRIDIEGSGAGEIEYLVQAIPLAEDE